MRALFLASLFFLLLLLASAPVAGEDRAAKPRPPRDVRALLLARCSGCHDPGRVFHRQASPDEWREIVYRMQRMPQSGISPKDAKIILDYLVARRGRAGAAPTADAPAGPRRGGPAAFGKEWVAVLEIATVREGKARLGGRTYEVTRDGRLVMLKRGKKTRLVSLDDEGRVGRTSRVDHWRVGRVTYELHLVLYELRDGRIRLGRALKRLAP